MTLDNKSLKLQKEGDLNQSYNEERESLITHNAHGWQHINFF